MRWRNPSEGHASKQLGGWSASHADAGASCLLLKRGRSAAFADPDPYRPEAHHVWLPEAGTSAFPAVAEPVQPAATDDAGVVCASPCRASSISSSTPVVANTSYCVPTGWLFNWSSRAPTSLPDLSPSPFSCAVSVRFVKRPITWQRCAAFCRQHQGGQRRHAGHRRHASCAMHSWPSTAGQQARATTKSPSFSTASTTSSAIGERDSREACATTSRRGLALSRGGYRDLLK